MFQDAHPVLGMERRGQREEEKEVGEKDERGRGEKEETQKSVTLVSVLNAVAPSHESRMVRIFHVDYGFFLKPPNTAIT